MLTNPKSSEIIQKVKNLLTKEEENGVFLQIAESKLDDDWLYIVVTPKQAGVRAADHAALMSKIERQLRNDGDEHVLLVPALEE